MSKDKIAELAEVMDKISTKIDDWDYMKAMTLLQQLFQEVNNNTSHVKYYGPAAQQLADDNERLKYNNTRLKRNHKNQRKRWKETEEQLRGQINELLSEIEYLEQFKKTDLNGNNNLVNYL